jgi:hypothetical protein
MTTTTTATTLPNVLGGNERVFLIHREGFFTRDYFCNLKDIPAVLAELLEPNDSYTISEYWNKKFTRCSKKHLNEMFAANQIQFKIK